MIIWAREKDGFNAFVRELPVMDNTSGEPAPRDGARTMIPLTDPLTSLGNRNLLERDLTVYEGQVARYGLRSCVALIDIDDFRKFNDRYGHAAGDQAIVAVAERLANRSRSGDSVYRVGGDEFICLLPEQSLETGALAVDRMRRNIEELAIPHEDSSSGVLTVSAGLALLDAEHLKAASELLKDAETALYYARNPDANSIEGEENSDSTPSP
jgi:diguanylate cyclase (GGDEF)-like protein